MKTYQDYLLVPEYEKEQAEFVRAVINDHKGSNEYKTAVVAEDYASGKNTTITHYQKMVTDMYGVQRIDILSPVHRSCMEFFKNYVTQLTQYLLGNGVTWQNDADARLGNDFDSRLQEITRSAIKGGVAYGFFNYDHVDVFSAREFAPLYDEENGALRAGVRFWQINDTKPLRASLYTESGITEFMWVKNEKIAISDEWKKIDETTYFIPKVAYTQVVVESFNERQIYNGYNYPTFPIVPMWANDHHQSELVGKREKIDAYDMVANGFEDDLDNAQLYWIIKGAAGMDDTDLLQFLDRLRTVKAAVPADGQDVDAVTVQIPYEAREKLLDRLERRLYKDSMLLNPDEIAGGAATATQIKAAYEPQNNKADELEYQVVEFIRRLLSIVGIEDTPTFTRSVIVNTQEEVTTLVQAAAYLPEDYVTRKILTLLGDGDQAEEILNEMSDDSLTRLGNVDVNG